MSFPPVPKQNGVAEGDIRSIFLYLERLRELSFDEVQTIINNSSTIVTGQIGDILVDTSTIDFTYNSTIPSLSAIVKDLSISTAKLATNAVTFSKIQQIATDTLLGRDTTGLGNVEEISLAAELSFTGSQALQITTNGVTFSKFQQIATDRLLGRDTAATGNVEEISLNSDLAFSGSQSIQVAAYTGDVTKALGGTALTIANDAVTFAKMQNITSDRLLGRDTAASGDVEEIALATDHEFTGSQTIRLVAFTGEVTKAAGGTALTIANDAVTYAKMQNVANASRLLGRGSAAGAGDVEEITLGTGLTMTTTSLDTTLALAASTYTPTLNNVANLDASTAYACQYIRVGSVVTVSGRVDIDPTLAATATQLGISLPIASNFGNTFECAGTAFASGIAGQGAAILGDAANNRAELNYISGDITNQAMYFTFTYQVI